MERRRFVLGVAGLGVFLGTWLPSGSYAYDRQVSRTGRAVVAPNVRFVTPPRRVAIVCGACGRAASDLPDWVLRLGSRLHREGLELVPMAVAPAPDRAAEFAAVLAESGAETGSITAVSPSTAGAVVEKVLASIGPDDAATRAVRHLIAVDPVAGRPWFAQASWVVHHAKLDADFIRVTDFASAPERWLRRYASVVLALEARPELDSPAVVSRLEAYVSNGGGLAALGGLLPEAFDALFGIRRASVGEQPIREVVCDADLWTGADGIAFAYGPEWGLALPSIEAAPGARALCSGRTESGGRLPTVLATDRGRGRTLAWLTSELGDKSARGRILSSLLFVAAPCAAATLNAAVFYVDDCPMPMWGRAMPPLQQMTDAEYYTKVWWPGIEAVLKKYRVKPTFAFVLSYDDRTTPPFQTGYASEPPEPEADQDDRADWTGAETALDFARRLAAGGHEIALHGYNHQSLTVAKSEKSAGWPGLAEMVAALEETRSEMRRIFGDDRLPAAYVAPNNLLHALGKQALHQVFPEITAFATQYLDEDSILGQEFGPDPDIPAVTDIPRISSENFLDAENAAEVLDALASPGVFSHFIHPDDLFDPARSRGMDFEGLRAELDRFLARIFEAYPFLDRLTASEFARRVREFSGARLEVTRGERSLILRAAAAPPDGLPVVVKLPPGTDSTASPSCSLVHRAVKAGRLVVRVGESPCIVHWE